MRHFSGLRRPSRGFSAVEIIAVATVIAILSLILIPMLRDRVADSRGKAALQEMGNLANVAVLANSENGHYFRLQDLDNTDRYSGPADARTSTVPFAYYNNIGAVVSLSASQRRELSRSWKGPYTSPPNTVAISELASFRPEILSVGGGPIVVFTGESADRYMVDPWGNPYLFFLSVETLYGAETTYQGRPALFSMGPDGMPGTLTTAGPLDYFPQTGPLGQGDDLTWNL